jgi:hypothetical protein
MGCETIIQMFFHMLLNIKLYHWQTTVYARHIASDTLHGKLSELIDKFVEVYIGRYNKRPKFSNHTFSVQVKQFNDNNVVDILQEYIHHLKYEVPKQLHSTDTDLLNIRDEMMAELNQTLYLFTLN